MPRLKDVDSEERNEWVKQLFRDDPQISQPKMQKMVKSRYKNTMRAKKIYELRNQVLKELGWTKDEHGMPVPPAKRNGKKLNVPALRSAQVAGEALSAAHREGDQMLEAPEASVLFKTCLVPVEDESDGASFKTKLEYLRSKGQTTMKVDSFTSTYAVVSRD